MIYKVSKRMEISAAHKLNLPYESKCINLHGHNYIVYVYCMSTELNSEGMVIDFAHVKKHIHEVLDHHYLNDIIEDNPTAENIATWISKTINKYLETNNKFAQCYKVTVQESEGNTAEVVLPVMNFSIMDELNSSRTYIER